MQRGSDKHSPRVDENLRHETEGMVRSGHPTRAREDREVEPTVTDDGTSATERPDAADEEFEADRESGG
ncbi:hypothetical protein [Allonocardiopsis opalescens]|uniref:Uncharacterized protein n=1 Tax=Allonocardiopsis opalescens TaxID=1144618 RepID=A0A2T0QAH6_9ACTN|nr:hypothetical protein [Allonocardiopsis opalescens]PRY00825.1 hypothetical protein CLV72_102457 [Allonocardiopsis opalescens]